MMGKLFDRLLGRGPSMPFDLEEINLMTVKDPAGFVAECDAVYQYRVEKAADMISANIKNSPVVLLSGPSGSGKTTTAQKIERELGERGIRTYTLSMDNYYLPPNPETSPRNPDGTYDFEDPRCLDIELLNSHFTKLARGERILVPKYEFSTQTRAEEPAKVLQLKENEVAIFEGIHALNSLFTAEHPEAFKLYISARSNVAFNDTVVFKGTWMRLVRRSVRDHLFRSYDPAVTISMWGSVRAGEKKYISPFKDKADLELDTAHACEMPIMNSVATELFSTIPEGIDRYEELKQVFPAIQLFGHIDYKYVPEDSLIREFIGGGVYEQ